MTPKPRLLLWMLGPTLPQLIAIPVACVWVLFAHTPLFDFWYGFIPFVFVLVHSLAIVHPLGQTRSESFAFLYARGFTRDRLWSMKMLASAVAALSVWLPAALLVWSGARATVLDRLFRSPLYPLVAPRETWVPLLWLAAYGLFLPTIHYAWIRRAQPVSQPQSGDWLALAVAIAALVLWSGPDRALWSSAWFQAMVWAVGALVSVTLLLAGRRLHRGLEVSP